MTDLKEENPLYLSWHDLAWIPHLNPTNILDYFSQRSNPFYDHTCNNELIRMQKLSLELKDMQGTEYILLHVQEPILFVIRKQTRHSPNQVTPIADYYIIAGYVYQAPDLHSLISFRLTSAIHHLVSAFDESQSYMRYHPTKGYSWEFNKDEDTKDKDLLNDKNKDKQKEEPSSAFQRARVDLLLGELCKNFFPKETTTTNTVNVKSTTTSQIDQKPAVQNGDVTDRNTDIKPDKLVNNQTNNSTNQNSNFNRTGNQLIDKKQRIN